MIYPIIQKTHTINKLNYLLLEMIDQDNPENNTHTSWIHRLCDNNYFQSFSNHPTKLEL